MKKIIVFGWYFILYKNYSTAPYYRRPRVFHWNGELEICWLHWKILITKLPF